MFAAVYQADPNTKPSRLKRRRKKRWKLTDKILCGTVSAHSKKTSAGRENPFQVAIKTPQPLAAFLCLPFSTALIRVYSVMAGLFRQRSALAAPLGGFSPCLSPPPDTVRSIRGGYSLSSGVTAMTTSKPAYQRNQSQASKNVTLKRRIDRLVESITRVDADLFTNGATEGDLLCLEIDAQRMADYCRFIRQSRAEG
ncbi:hypothetical protein [Methylotuvimicrobium buryatense]|uniref:Uncharacterized protein n=1 Tax=Methylotuvimicrobium buryatense TaxID=95641 RepID=A0A4P9UUT9_METBY|nr:hypothetical protein [Methylotuvimicrobium buryatense]QCW84373.1 hypothetical protein EQU24_20655 [Methylotuvimicrobium buryatense]